MTGDSAGGKSAATKPLLTDRPRIYTRLMNRYRRLGWYLPGVPTLIRWTLVLHAQNDRSRVRRRCAGQQARIEQWLSQGRLFFGFGLFRSGTTFLARALNVCMPEAVVRHEPNICDYLAYAEALADPGAARAYIRNYRLGETWLRMRADDSPIYGEVNPYLRRHAAALREALPDAAMFHLVRDGRDVVRSLASRELFARHDPMARLIRPPASDACAPLWPALSRFEKLCWLWQADNRHLRETLGRPVHFERLLGDFAYCQERVLAPAGLDVSAETWAAATESRINPTRDYVLPAWPDWSGDMRDTFERICGDEMTACGYVR